MVTDYDWGFSSRETLEKLAKAEVEIAVLKAQVAVLRCLTPVSTYSEREAARSPLPTLVLHS